MSLVQIDSIYVPPARYRDEVWTYDEEHVSELAENIRETRLINPITVRPTTVVGYRYELGSGLHRLEAFRHLGRKKIEATVYYDMDEDQWQDHIVSENLFRKDSRGFFVRGQLLRRKMEIARRLHPERFKPGPKPKEVKEIKTPIEETSEKTGIAPTTLVEDLRIAEELPPELVKRLHDIGAYKKTILNLTRATEEKKRELMENFDKYAHALSSEFVSEKQASRFAMEQFVYSPVPAERREEAEEEVPEQPPLLEPEEMPASVDSGWVARQALPVLSGTGTRHLNLDLFYNEKTGRFMFVRTLKTADPVTQTEMAGLRFLLEKLNDVEGFRGVHTLRREHDGTILINEARTQERSLRSFLQLASQAKGNFFTNQRK